MDLLDFMAQNCLLSFRFIPLTELDVIERALRWMPDVIVCDLNLPE
jgi:CheY-like chemotaxis protein